MPKANHEPKELHSKQYEELGRIVAAIYETGYLNRAQSYKMSFLKGMIGGLGGVIGATIVVAILIWVLSLIGHIPFIGGFVDSIRETINAS